MISLFNNHVKNLILFFFTFVASLIPFLKNQNGKYFGEPFDTRFQIVIHEHWYWFLKADRPLRDTFLFYPFEDTLGFSDIFLLNGVTYSIFRFVNFEILQAWHYTNFVIIFLGALGFTLLAKNLFKSLPLLLLFIILIINNSAFTSLLYIWPNSVGYLLLSWIYLALYKIYKNYTLQETVIWINFLFFALPILVLSFWYPGFFALLTTVFFLIFINLFNPSMNLKKLIKSYISHVRPLDLLILFVSSCLWILFIFITYPTIGNLRRSKEEVIKGSLNFQEFFFTTLLGASPFSKIYESLSLDTGLGTRLDWQIGFSPLLVLIFTFVIIYTIKDYSKYQSNVILKISLILVLTLVFITAYNDSSLYIYLSHKFDILGIIRTPLRLNVLITLVALLIIFKFFDNYFLSSNLSRKLFIFTIAIILFIDMFRIIPNRWSSDLFLDKNLENQSNPIKQNCRYFSVTNVGSGHWSDTMFAMVLSANINVPTINGYSGTSPKDVIEREWIEPSSIRAIEEYVNRNNLELDGCIVSYNYFRKLSNIVPEDLVITSGPDYWESLNDKYWVWLTSSKITFDFNSLLFKKNSITFNFKKPECNSKIRSIDLRHNKVNHSIAVEKDSDIPSIQLKNVKYGDKIQIFVSADGCKIKNDARTLIVAIEPEGQ